MDAPPSVFRIGGVTDGAKVVLLYLWVRARADRPTSWPSLSTIATDVGRTERSVRRHLAALEKLGEIERVGHNGAAVVWRVNLERHCGQNCPPGGDSRTGLSLVRTGLSAPSLEEDTKEDTDPVVTTTDAKDLPIAERRKVAANVVWNTHEQRCVDRGIGRLAHGGGLRRPTPKDLAAILRCAKTLKSQENLRDERRVWQILRHAAIAAVDRAADAREDGDDMAEKLVEWRRRDPFGGKKLGPMLAELERRLRGGDGGKVYRHREGRDDLPEDRRRELEERVRKANSDAGGDDEDQAAG